MSQGGLRKVGWVWTKTGWKRVPKRSRAVKKVSGTGEAPPPESSEDRRRSEADEATQARSRTIGRRAGEGV
jgi:hypothetical protein